MFLLEVRIIYSLLMGFLKRIWKFYIESFTHMGRYGNRLMLIILIKLIIIFAILKVFFFRDFLDSRFNTDQEKSEYILNQLTNP